MKKNSQSLIELDEKEDIIFRKRYGDILKSVRIMETGSCPSAETLIRYSNQELAGGLKRTTENHIALCSGCWKALETLQALPEQADGIPVPDNWILVEKSLNDRFNTRLNECNPPVRNKKYTSETEWPRLVAGWVNHWKLRPVLVYTGMIGILAVSMLYLQAWLGRDSILPLARINPGKQAILRSPSVESDFTAGMDWMRHGNYKKAAIRLIKWSAAHPDDYESRYYLGVALLCDAEKSLPGLVYGFDDSKVERGITAFREALALAGDNVFYQADCRWYLGKAFLMKNEPEKARSEFDKIIGLNPPYGERLEEARTMIAAIDRLEKAGS